MFGTNPKYKKYGLTTLTALDKHTQRTFSRSRKTVSIKFNKALTSFGKYPLLSFSRMNSSKIIVVTFE